MIYSVKSIANLPISILVCYRCRLSPLNPLHPRSFGLSRNFSLLRRRDDSQEGHTTVLGAKGSLVAVRKVGECHLFMFALRDPSDAGQPI